MATKVSALTKTTTLDSDDLIYIAKSNSVAITKQNFENTLSLNVNTNSRIVRGGVVWVSGLIYETVDLIYEINGTQYDITNGTQVTLSTADATNPRIDVIYGDDLGAISIEAGTPLATPVKPTIQEGYQIELTFATVAATATEPTGVAIDTLYLEDVGQPTEWDATDNTGGVRIDTADTTTPITGTKSIRTIATLTDLDSFTLTNATPVNTAELNYLRLSIKLLNTMQKKEFITVNLKSATTVVGSFIIDQNAIDRTDLTTQTLTIFNADFGAFTGTSFDNIEFPCRSLGTIQYQIDDITIFTSDVITSPTNITGEDVSLDTTNFINNLDSASDNVQKMAQAFDDYVAAGGGDVVGAASSVNENIVLFSGTSGKLIKDSGINKTAVTANTAKTTNATHTGDVTGATALTIGSNKVTNAMLSTVATSTFKGRKTAGTGNAEDLTISDAQTLLGTKVEYLTFACSDEATALAAATGVLTFRMPYGMTLTGIKASVNTAPTGSVLTVDVNESGVSILSTKLTIDATEKTSTTAATPAVISDANLADDAEITVDLDGVGSTISGEGLKLTLIGNRT